MIRKYSVLITVILVIFVTGISQAQVPFPPQVQYELEIWELLNKEERKLALEAFEFSPGAVAQFSYEVLTRPNLNTIIGGIPFSIRASTTQKISRLATPAVVVTLGQEAILRVVEETHNHTNGIEIKAAPLMLDETSGEIFSKLEINTYDPENRIQTNVGIQSGTKLPLAIVRFANETNNSSEDRVFSVFVKADIINQPSSESTVAIGGLGGMSNLLWPDEIHFQQDNYIWVALPLYPLTIPEGGLKLWVGPRTYINAEVRGEPYSEANMTLGFRLMPEGLSLEAQLITGGQHSLIAFGLSDRVEAAPGLYLSGGILPGVFELDNFNRMKMRWWGEAKFTFQPIQLTIRYNSNGETGTLESEIGYGIEENSRFFVRHSMSEVGHAKIASGIRFTF